MMYFKGTVRAIYAVYTQRLGQYVYCTVVITELYSWLSSILDSIYTRRTNQLTLTTWAVWSTNVLVLCPCAVCIYRTCKLYPGRGVLTLGTLYA